MGTEAKALQVGQQFTYAGKDGITYTVESVKPGPVVYVVAKGSNGERATFMFPPTAQVEAVSA